MNHFSTMIKLTRRLLLAGGVLLAVPSVGLAEEVSTDAVVTTQAFKDYWYGGEAEITSYTLQQARYGELHEGTAVLVYVTEPFSSTTQVKADDARPENVSVLKLNASKKFLTGIYPYSIISSTFSPIEENTHAIKISSSTQEWCGHSYTQLNNREHFDIVSHSYFEGEADQELRLAQVHLENDVWNKIRLDPKRLPLGDIHMLPSFDYIRLRHQDIQAYKANASLVTPSAKTAMAISTYVLEYPGLKRRLEIDFRSNFPYEIEGWRETYKSGFDNSAKELSSVAKKIKTIKSDYWNRHGNRDRKLRRKLGL